MITEKAFKKLMVSCGSTEMEWLGWVIVAGVILVVAVKAIRKGRF